MGLTFRGNTRLFSNINLNIREGDFYFLTGLSGAGKSTLLKAYLHGHCPHRWQRFSFWRRPKTNDKQRLAWLRRKMGIIFQDFRLLPHLTALENVALPLKVRGIDQQKATGQAQDLLAWVGLEHVMNQYPATLSGGQQQRVAITRSIMGRPALLLADEPTGNVDEEAAEKIMHLFEELHKTGTTIVLATHNRSLAKEFNHPEIFLKKGQAFLLNKKPRSQEGGI
ncbi:MAG: ATP-binding cassette domain-containing protein [Holosporaceae bacterium]|nr:MAG: ATP-binding cassette domain-containing protein [Holosporaceae bacterium]